MAMTDKEVNALSDPLRSYLEEMDSYYEKGKLYHIYKTGRNPDLAEFASDVPFVTALGIAHSALEILFSIDNKLSELSNPYR